MRIAHIAINFSLWRQSGHRVDYHQIHRIRTNQRLRNFQCLLAVIWLRNQQIFRVHAQTLSVCWIKSVLGINKRRRSTLLLNLRNSMKRQRCLTRAFWTINFYDTTLRISAAKRQIQTQSTRRNYFNIDFVSLAQFHNRSVAKLLSDLIHC